MKFVKTKVRHIETYFKILSISMTNLFPNSVRYCHILLLPVSGGGVAQAGRVYLFFIGLIFISVNLRE